MPPAPIPSPRRYAKGYTALVFAAGSVAFVAMLELTINLPAPRDRALHVPMELGRSLFSVLWIASWLVAALRWRRSRLAQEATAALSLAYAFVFPIGTLIFLYWLLRIRPVERRERIRAGGAFSHRFTVLLYLLAGTALVTGLLVEVVAEGRTEGPALPVVGPLLFLLCLWLVTAGLLRAGSFDGARDVTRWTVLILLPLFPLGTGTALYWLLRLRRREGGSDAVAP